MSGGAMFGSRLRKLRLARGMTQKELAGDRYTHAYVSSIEAGRRMPSREALQLKAETGYAYLARGYVLSREERLDEARTELEQAREIFEQTGDEKDLTRTLNELGRIERLNGDVDRATTLLQRSIGLLGTSDT